jgi:hypothetical protein
LIGGLGVVLLYKELTPWVGAFLLLALVMFIFGVAHTLLHMTFHSKMLFALVALLNRTEHVPNAVDGEEPTLHAYQRMQVYAQRAFGGQWYYLLIGVTSGGIGLVVQLWQYSCRAIILIGVAFSFLLALALALRIWKIWK